MGLRAVHHHIYHQQGTKAQLHSLLHIPAESLNVRLPSLVAAQQLCDQQFRSPAVPWLSSLAHNHLQSSEHSQPIILTC